MDRPQVVASPESRNADARDAAGEGHFVDEGPVLERRRLDGDKGDRSCAGVDGDILLAGVFVPHDDMGNDQIGNCRSGPGNAPEIAVGREFGVLPHPIGLGHAKFEGHVSLGIGIGPKSRNLSRAGEKGGDGQYRRGKTFPEPSGFRAVCVFRFHVVGSFPSIRIPIREKTFMKSASSQHSCHRLVGLAKLENTERGARITCALVACSFESECSYDSWQTTACRKQNGLFGVVGVWVCSLGVVWRPFAGNGPSPRILPSAPPRCKPASLPFVRAGQSRHLGIRVVAR